MCVNKLETMSYKNEIRRSNAAALMGASSCVDVALGFSDFPNIHRIGLPANPRLKSNSSNKSFRAFTCDRGGRLQKSGKVGLDDRSPQMDKRVRKEAPHSEVKKVPFSRSIGHLLPVACGGSAEDKNFFAKFSLRDALNSYGTLRRNTNSPFLNLGNERLRSRAAALSKQAR
ncbi:hypothetical protein LZ757_01920 [Xylella fastidiosa subsp. morus]|nr:hypothetical protein [Xylella fastidiosa]UIT37023.1 hypothetical protein LZ757_01920 [Xylella fastidiosa subsp. morus]UIT39317.1 hypothetical protein LZ755_01925 [Xylella fastidiosa subsp. morus]